MQERYPSTEAINYRQSTAWLFFIQAGLPEGHVTTGKSTGPLINTIGVGNGHPSPHGHGAFRQIHD